MSTDRDRYYEDYYDDCPCNDCESECDGWDAMFCCALCAYEGRNFCEECDPMDI